MTLTDVEIGEISLKTRYKIDTYSRELDELGTLEPEIGGVKLKDGTFVEFWVSSSGFQDRDNLIYFKDAYATNGVVDLSQVESVAFIDRWEKNPDTGRSAPVYKYIPFAE